MRVPLCELGQFDERCGLNSVVAAESTNTRLTIKQQLSLYILKVKPKTKFQDFWKEFSTELPNLTKLVQRYNAVPATSAL
ncbi:unnamed protein product [Didymodactylos carnosus]|uniref:Uncharacterized protein n=1 Tax=Didymodactylos carnosus TaxID=1234261 RepID=A0A813TQU3_9BILA|nr:unnamed protein product [Didymodactylos carnosus]CAF1014818.1 unnamed protein product [Didymodactylos carnosus]CAF3604249.1 unnamed protein product [Didymodactylos carnosus]CAF3783892.1 unnamed protein product [Didymodactylos carnosus]